MVSAQLLAGWSQAHPGRSEKVLGGCQRKKRKTATKVPPGSTRQVLVEGAARQRSPGRSEEAEEAGGAVKDDRWEAAGESRQLQKYSHTSLL